MRQRFVGEICGFGTASGVRVVIGRWSTSPYGAFTDAMVEHADGRRVLVAPSAEIAAFVGAIYTFDEVVIADVDATRTEHGVRVEGGPLGADVSIGERDALGWALRLIPRPLAGSEWWPALIDPLARVLLGGVRTRGRTRYGRTSYGATDRHKVTAARATWEGTDLGALADVDPPVRFGFGSTPRRPSIVSVVTTIRPGDDGSLIGPEQAAAAQ